jgi:hypothetical protein
LNLAFLIAIETLVIPVPASAQFKQTIIKAAVCGGGAYGGFKLGEKLAQLEASKKKLTPEQAKVHLRAFQIGMAAALCGTGVLLTGTVYAKLSKRDREAREKEMAAALADANPGTRNYVLPDSKMAGRLETDAPEKDGDKECRSQVDFLAKDDEPAAARWCRKSAKDKYELEL